jgi:hypothetical protein
LFDDPVDWDILSFKLRSYGTLRVVSWYLVNEVSGQNMGPNFKRQATTNQRRKITPEA